MHHKQLILARARLHRLSGAGRICRHAGIEGWRSTQMALRGILQSGNIRRSTGLSRRCFCAYGTWRGKRRIAASSSFPYTLILELLRASPVAFRSSRCRAAKNCSTFRPRLQYPPGCREERGGADNRAGGRPCNERYGFSTRVLRGVCRRRKYIVKRPEKGGTSASLQRTGRFWRWANRRGFQTFQGSTSQFMRKNGITPSQRHKNNRA